MVQHVFERVRRSSYLSDVFIATDDDRVAEAVRGFKGKVIKTSSEHPSGTDRVAEIAERMEVDLVVNVQGDEPLVDAKAIDEALECFTRPEAVDIATLAMPITEARDILDPNVVKVYIDSYGYATFFSRSPLFSLDLKKQGKVRHYQLLTYRHIGLYAYRREVLLALASLPPTEMEKMDRLEQFRALEHGYRIRVVETNTPSYGVDTPKDLEKVASVMASGVS
jgi:3-deoxy-manno-octulosonate cytidylyltransferase (CMP-KDO synthetase)